MRPAPKSLSAAITCLRHVLRMRCRRRPCRRTGRCSSLANATTRIVRCGCSGLSSAPAAMVMADAGGIVDRAGARVPGIEVAADQHDFVGLAAAGDLADHVLRGVFAVEAAIERDAHAGRAEREQARELVGVGHRQRRGRDRRQPVVEAGDAGMRRARASRCRPSASGSRPRPCGSPPTGRRRGCRRRCRSRCRRARASCGSRRRRSCRRANRRARP